MNQSRTYKEDFKRYEWTNEDRRKWKAMRDQTWEINHQDKLNNAPQKIFSVDFINKKLLNITEVTEIYPANALDRWNKTKKTK